MAKPDPGRPALRKVPDRLIGDSVQPAGQCVGVVLSEPAAQLLKFIRRQRLDPTFEFFHATHKWTAFESYYASA